MATEFQWPVAATPDGWSLAGWWLPAQSDVTQGASVLFSVVDVDDVVVGSVTYDTTSDSLVAAVGAAEAESAALTFDADEPVFFAVRFDTTTGLALTVVVDGDAEHVADGSTDPGTTAATFERLTLGAINGVLDELIIFAGRLTDAQCETLAAATSQLAGLPSDPRPVWYAAFDSALAPTGGSVASGRRKETAADNGLYRIVAALQDVADHAPLGLESDGTVTLIEFAAGLVTETGDDTAADVHDQFAAASAQETRVR